MEKLPPGTVVSVGSHSAEVVSYLAEGGFAHIYKVKCTPIEQNEEAAVLKRVIVKSKPELNVLRKEVDTMKRLAQSKYAVRYYDSNAQKLEDGTYEVLLLMEYCPNKSLLDYMNLHLKSKLGVDQITKIMYQITQALADMHSLQLIHRDLKIENVLIDSKGDFKLADFGSTSAYLPAPTNQEEFQYVAHDIIHNTTPQYRAPEMIDLYRGLPINDKSDIWALGVFLFKLMYYTTPFETQGELAILHGYFQFPQAPKYPSRLKNLVIIMLQVNPMLRPNTYQVLCEICDMINKPVPIKDAYGIGKYDFDAYAKYQQQIQLQQQQAQMQQQYLIQKQQEQLAQNQNQNQNLVPPSQPHSHETSPQPAQSALKPQYHEEDNDESEQKIHRSKSVQSIQPHELARSSKSSVGDLKSLNDQLSRDAGSEEEEGEEEEEEGEEEDPDFDNIEDRFPDLDDIEAVKQKFPDIEDVEQPRKSMDGSIASSGSKVDGIQKSRDASRSPVIDPEAPKLGLKLSHTEAWTIPPTEKVDIEIDGVFHREPQALPPSQEQSKQERPQSQPQDDETIDDATVTESVDTTAPQEGLKVKSSFDNLFDDFETQPVGIPSAPSTTTSISQPSSRVPSQPAPSQKAPLSSMSQPGTRVSSQYNIIDQPMSRNPFPTPGQLAPSAMSKNPFPTAKHASTTNPSMDGKNAMRSERPGANPWAQFAQKPQTPVMRTAPTEQKPALPTRPKEPQLPALPTRPEQQFTPSLSPQMQQHTSPSITLTPAEVKLIDLDDEPKEHRPKLDLNMRTFELDTDKNVTEEDDGDTDTDSNGDLKVEVMKVRTTSKSSNEARSSTELKRLNLDLQELDLDDEAVEDDTRHSRRSMSLKRNPSSGLRKSSRSRASDKETKEKRKSFLGF